MVEGIPAFFAAAKYGLSLILIMAVVFAASTILTYVLLCIYSTATLQRIKFGSLERYGEVISGAFIALVGLAFSVFRFYKFCGFRNESRGTSRAAPLVDSLR